MVRNLSLLVILFVISGTIYLNNIFDIYAINGQSEFEYNIQLTNDPLLGNIYSGFIQNIGQLPDSSIKYFICENDVSVGFASSLIVFQSRKDEALEFTLSFPNSNNIEPVGVKKKNSYLNYYMNGLTEERVSFWRRVFGK